MKPPIQETNDLLKASSNYLRDPRPETELVFYEALAALEAAEQLDSATARLSRFPDSSKAVEQQRSTLSRPHFGSVVRRHLALLGAVATLVILSGMFIVYKAASPPAVCPAGMNVVPQGAFLMGASDQDPDAHPDEKPQRQVSLDAFCIDHTEVSNEQYAAFLSATNYPAPLNWNGSSYPPGVNQNYKDLPVVFVSWIDAQSYCIWQHKKLPTEAQWEKAARGADGLTYPWGNTFDPTKANYGETRPRGLQTVDSYSNGQSPYGVLNMAGNVAEWTSDLYLADAYSRMPDLNPEGPTDSASGTRVVRGGSYVDAMQNLRTTARLGTVQPTQTQGDIGFRCATQAAK